MKMNKRMFDIHTKMKALYDEAIVLNNNGECTKAAAKMDEYDALKKQYAFEEKLFSEQSHFAPESAEKAVGAEVLEGAEGAAKNRKDSVAAFAEAFRKGFPVDKAVMAEGTPASAGYLVPQDIQTAINHYNEATFDFSQYINVEPVTTNVGTRIYAVKTNDFAFEEVAETGEIPLTAVPQYEPVTYSIKDFGGIVPVSKNLMNDSDQSIVKEISMWMAKGKRGTVNSKVLALLRANTEKEIADLDDIRKLLITELGGAYNSTSAIYTNDDGIAWLSNLKDENRREYLTYNPTEPAKMQLAIGAKVVPVINIPNCVAPSVSSGGNTKIPFFIGDLKAGITCFDREQMTIASSDTASVGTGENQLNAFSQRLILFRACQRMDFKAVDAAAYVNGVVTV